MAYEDNSEAVGYRYAVIPEWILDGEINDRAVRLFCILSRYVGANDSAWPSRTTMAKRLNCSVDSLDRALKDLIDIGAVKVERRHREDGSYSSSRYYLWPHLGPQVAAPVPPGSRTRAARVAAPVRQHEGTTNEGTTSNSEVLTQRRKNKKVGYSADFDEVWKSYPRRINKAGAYKAYCSTIKRGSSVCDLFNAVEAYAAQRIGQDEAYTLHPATFFGPDERWRDYLPVEEKLSAQDVSAAAIYDLYDSGLPWGGESSFDNPAKHGYTRPIDSKGRLIDANGKTFDIDTASGQRKYIREQ
jgi:hypothetical protein